MTKKIRINGLPPRGEIDVPDWVSEAFVGLELPVVDISELPYLKQVDWVGGDNIQHADGHVARIEDVFTSLKEVDPKAEKWLKDIIPYALPSDDSAQKSPIGKMLVGTVRFMIFDEEFCEIVE